MPRPPGAGFRLVREATQLKAVGAVVCVAGAEMLRMEKQVQTANAAQGGRPAKPAVTDSAQPAIGTLAVARGAPTRCFTGCLGFN